MRRVVGVLQRLAPAIVLIHGIYNLWFYRPHRQWGLPASYWYWLEVVTACLMLVLDLVARKDPK